MTIFIFSKPNNLPLQATISSQTSPHLHNSTTTLDVQQVVGETSSNNENISNHNHQTLSTMCLASSASLDKPRSPHVMQFPAFGPKLSLNRSEEDDDTTTINGNGYKYARDLEEKHATVEQIQFLGEMNHLEKCPMMKITNTTKAATQRKRARTAKTIEEIESQRMIHIAVERNRRKQISHLLTVLRSLMPASYVQRGDQASIVGGAIEFVRELEQLLECLESQKRRRLNGPIIIPMEDSSLSSTTTPMEQLTPFLPHMMSLPCDDDNDQIRQVVEEKTAESKSCLGYVQVKIQGVDGIIKIVTRKKQGEVIKMIAALEDMQLNILDINITTIEQTRLYSFNVKVGAQVRYTAEDITKFVQQILSFTHVNKNANVI